MVNACRIKKKEEGITITFQTRGIDKDKAHHIWNRLDPLTLEAATQLTGHNLYVWKDGLVAEIRKTNKNNYVVWCGETIDD